MISRIEVITYHKPDGSIKPLRFRIEAENCELQTVKIHNVLDVTEEKTSTSLVRFYTCNAVVNNVMKNFKLKFDVLNTCWYIIQ